MNFTLEYLVDDAIDLFYSASHLFMVVVRLIINTFIWVIALGATAAWLGLLFSSIIGAVMAAVFAPMWFLFLPMYLIKFTLDLE